MKKYTLEELRKILNGYESGLNNRHDKYIKWEIKHFIDSIEEEESVEE